MLRYLDSSSWIGEDGRAHVEIASYDSSGERVVTLIAFDSANDLLDFSQDLRHTGNTWLREAPRPKPYRE